MNIFINVVTLSGVIILFDNERQIVFQKEINILWNESSKLIAYIDTFLVESWTAYNDLDNIVVVNWPWSFTWIRTIVLAINSINYIIKKSITPISFFDLFDNYPIIKSSSRRDLFVKYRKNASIEIVPNNDFLVQKDLEGGEKIFWDISNNTVWEQLEVDSHIDYKKIINQLEFQDNKIIEPLYIKKPNIS